MSEGWPTVPTADLDAGGWTRVGRTAEVVFGLSSVEVVGRTDLYEAPASGDLPDDSLTRFFFATRLSFSPSLPSGAERLVESTVVRRARESFAEDLRDRGFEDLTTREQGRIRTETGATAQLSNVRAVGHVEGASYGVTGWLAVWRDDGFRLAGGAYPVSDETDADRAELLELVRKVA